MENDDMEVIITDNKTVRWYFQHILYESILNNKDKVVLSTIHKYKYIVECLLVFLEMHGWELNKDWEYNPMEEKQQGKKLVLTFLKYHLIRNPVNKAIIEEKMKEKTTQEVLTYLLERLKIDRKEKDFNKW